MIIRNAYFVLMMFVIMSGLIECQMSNIETYTFLTRCNNKSLNYDFKSPIEIFNHELQWESSKFEVKECAFNIIKNSTDSIRSFNESSFIIKFKFNSTICQELKKPKIAITLLDFTQNNKSIVNNIGLCDELKQSPFILINSTSSFQLKLIENEPISYPFSSIESIIITSFTYAQSEYSKL
jgi:hypothetical protein